MPEPNNTMNDKLTSFQIEQQRELRSRRLVVLIVRLLFLSFMFVVAVLPFVATASGSQQPIELVIVDHLGPAIATLAFASIILIIDILTPKKRLSAVFGVYLGLVAGLFAALAVGLLIDLIADSWGLSSGDTALQYLTLLKLATGITLCYLAISIVITTKDDLRLVLPYIEFSRQVRGIRPLLVDTSIIIDGRIEQLASSRFIDAPLIVPQFVIDELHVLSDSHDKLKRSRGRRGLSILANLRAAKDVDITIEATDQPEEGVDRALLSMASGSGYRVLTTDSNLEKIGLIEGVAVLNLNNLAQAVRTQAVPGAEFEIEIVKHGEAENQGVGYLPDGTMVVIDDAAHQIGSVIRITVNNALQTAAGRMIFAHKSD
ncbi:PIN/TRAM domain-containing protein [PVC group bacterium]|nr:PIN/TRAM domain-containing protein [PVC group bacterium]